MRYIVLLYFLLFIFSGCEDSVNTPEPVCGVAPIYLEEDGTILSDPYQITNASMREGCLEIEVTSSGCDGSSWEGQLFVFPDVAESYPPQVRIAFSLANQELCDAVIKKSFIFDLSGLKSISDRVILNLDHWENSILFPGINLNSIIGTWDLININGGLLGQNTHFNPGDIKWTFDENQLTIQVTIDDELTGLLSSGVYDYSFTQTDSFIDYPDLVVDGIDLGPVTRLNTDSLVIDQRPVDGFQYVFITAD